MIGNISRLITSLRPREFFFLVLLLSGIIFLFLAVIGQISWPPKGVLDLTSRYVSGGIGAILILGSLLFFIQNKKENGVEDANPNIKVLQSAGGPEVANRLLKLAAECSEEDVCLIGTGLAFLQPVNPLHRLIELVDKGHIRKLELIFANPYSNAVRTRLLEEQCANPAANIGLDGLDAHIRNVLNNIEASPHYPNRISIKLFSNYPTFALLKVGVHYLVYSYSFAEIGNQSPVIEFKRDCVDLSTFYDHHHERLRSASIDAVPFLAARSGHGNISQLDLQGFAIYFIPESGDFFDLGSKILGYDIRRNQYITSEYEVHVGPARQYGFHLTLADALFTCDSSTIDCIEKIAERICADWTPITLKYEIVAGFPDENSISLRCTDATRQLLALHRELVHHIYPLAIGSNYTLGNARMNRCYCKSKERNNVMTRLFHAPYILDCFKPHFTLLDSVSTADELKKETLKIRTEFEQLGIGSQVTVGSVSVMRKPPDADSWIMPDKDIPLN